MCPIWTRYYPHWKRGLAKFNPRRLLYRCHTLNRWQKQTAPDLKIRMEEASKFYELEGIESEAELSRFFWTTKKENHESLELTDVIQ